MRKSWHERGQYANMIKEVLSLQVEAYKKENDNAKKTKIAQSIGYLGQTINSFITEQAEDGFTPEIPENEEISVSEKEIEEFVKSELKQTANNLICKNDLLQDITQFKNCHIDYTNLFFVKMENLGLKVCKDLSSGCFDIEKFAIMRNYTTSKSEKKNE